MIARHDVFFFKQSIMAYSMNEITFTQFYQYLQDVYRKHPTENLREYISNIKDDQSSTMLKVTIPTDSCVEVIKMVIGRGGINLYNLTEHFALDFAWHNRETNEFELYSLPGSSIPIKSAASILLRNIQYMKAVVASRVNPISLDEEPQETISLDEPQQIISLDNEEEADTPELISLDDDEVETPDAEEPSFENTWGNAVDYINDDCLWDLNQPSYLPPTSPPLFSGAGATPVNDAAKRIVNRWDEDDEEDINLHVHWAPDTYNLPQNIKRTQFNSPLPSGWHNGETSRWSDEPVAGWGGEQMEEEDQSPSFQVKLCGYLDQNTTILLKNTCDFWLDANDVLTFSNQISHKRMKSAMSLLKVNGFTPLSYSLLLHGEPTQWHYNANNLQESLNTVISQQNQFERKFVYILDIYEFTDYWNSLVMKFANLIDDEEKVKRYIWTHFAFELNLNSLDDSCPDVQRPFHWVEQIIELMRNHPEVCNAVDHILDN